MDGPHHGKKRNLKERAQRTQRSQRRERKIERMAA
jgi:hypothetical protein